VSTATGLDVQVLADLRQRIQREVDDGRVPAAQMAVGLHGEVVHLECFGEARESTRFAVFSCTKAILAGVVWQLLGEGRLAADTPVVELVPSFAAAEGVTLGHLMTHTGGFPYAPLGPPAWADREARLSQFGRWRLQHAPGERFEYHPTAGHWVIAEMIEQVDGRDYREAVRQRVLEPLELEGFLLGEPARDVEVAPLVTVGAPPSAEELMEVLGIAELEMGEVTPEILLGFNDPDVRAVGIPGGGGVSSAVALAAYYQALLHDRAGLWDPAVLAEGTARVHCDLPDPMLGHPSNRTLGLVLAGDDGLAALRGMGHRVSPRAFGHNGAAGQIAFADPESGISFAFCTSGVELNPLREARRTAAIATRAAQLVG
jgi:CubicO group peptidase (beta-lactamase class C family)